LMIVEYWSLPPPLCWGSICVFKSNSVCLMKLGALTLGICKLMIVISSCCTAPIISVKWPSLSLLSNLGWSLLYLI
jgi:hypothetical protein